MITKGDLLQQAYKHIDSGYHQTAVDILESLVNLDPVNIEAWEAYMQICETCDELDNLCDRVLQVSEIDLVDRESILDYYYFLRQKKKICKAGDELEIDIKLELVSHFSFPLKSKFRSAKDNELVSNFERGLLLFLNRAILVPYAALLAISFGLLSKNNILSYWAFFILLAAVFLGKWNRISPVIFDGQYSSGNRSDSAGVQGKTISDSLQLHS
jgi:hypothetical protein